MKLYHARYAQPTISGVIIEEEDFYLPNAHEVRKHLRSKGFWPVRIHELKPPLFEWMDVRSRDWQMQLLRAIRFQSATASAGTALLNIIEGEMDPRRRLAFLPTRTVLKGGGSFSEALRELKLMDSATMAIIMAGERAGDLKGVVQHAIEHVEQKGTQYKAFVAAMSWLSFDIISVIMSIWGTQFGFIPYLKEQGTKNTDPGAAEKFDNGIRLVSVINGSMLIITSIIILAIVFFGISYWLNRHKSDHFTSQLMIKMPLLSDYLRNISFQDTCRLMTRLLRGKVPLDEALTIIIETTVEPSVRMYWTECRQRIMSGIEPSRALSRWPLTKAERDQIITIQSVDQLAEVFEAIAAERAMMAKTDQRKVVKLGIFLLMFLAGVTILTTIYLLMLQNQGFLNSLSDLRS